MGVLPVPERHLSAASSWYHAGPKNSCVVHGGSDHHDEQVATENVRMRTYMQYSYGHPVSFFLGLIPLV